MRLPPCYWCGRKSVVLINETGACIDHLDTSFGRAMEPVHQALHELFDKRE